MTSLLQTTIRRRISASPCPPPPQSAARADVDAAPAHLVGEGQHQAGAARADRVAERHRSPVHVHDVLVDPEHPRRVQRHRGERLVDLEQPEVVRRPGRPSSARFCMASAGTVCRYAYRSGRHAVGHDLRERRDAQPRRRAPSLMTTTAAAPSEICEALPAVIVPSAVNAGRSAASDSGVVSGRIPSSRANDDRVALALRDLDRHDLLGQPPGVPGLVRARGASGPPTRPAPRAPIPAPGSPRRSTRPCAGRVKRRPQAVVDHRVDQLRVAHARRRRAPSGAGTALASSTPCRRRRRPRARPRGSSGRPARWR